MPLMIAGLAYLMVVHKVSNHSTSSDILNDAVVGEDKFSKGHVHTTSRFWRKPPRLPPDEVHNGASNLDPNKLYPMSEWVSRQQKVKEAFLHAWSGYKSYAIGYDELMPLSHRGIDGLGGLGATIIDSFDSAMIIGADEIVSEAEMWIEEHLMERIDTKGQVNLFETTIHVLAGLLSAYHLSGGEHGTLEESGISVHLKEAKPEVFLKIAKNLADKLLAAFTSSRTSIPFSDVILHE